MSTNDKSSKLLTRLRFSKAGRFLMDGGDANPAETAAVASSLRRMFGFQRKRFYSALDIAISKRAVQPARMTALIVALDDGGRGTIGRALADAVARGGKRAQKLQDQVLESLALMADVTSFNHLAVALLDHDDTLIRTRYRVMALVEQRQRAGLAADASLLDRAADQVLAAADHTPRTLLLKARILHNRGVAEAAQQLYRLAYASDAETKLDRARILGNSLDAALRRHRFARDADLVDAATRDGQAIEPAADFAVVQREIARLKDRLPSFARERLGVLATVAELLPDDLQLAFERLLEDRHSPVDYAPEDRVLMLGNSLAMGGMERVLVSTVRQFRKSREAGTIDLALLDYHTEGTRAYFLPEIGIKPDQIYNLNAAVGEIDPALALLPINWQARVQNALNIIRATRPKALHAWNDITGVIAAFAGILAGVPRIIVHFHHLPAVPLSGQTHQVAELPAIYRLLLGRPEMRFLFCSGAAADAYADWWETPRDERFRLFHNPVTMLPEPDLRGEAARMRIRLRGFGPVVGTVFSFRDVKQPLLWVDIALKLLDERPDLRFIMVGQGALRNEAAKIVAKAGYSERFLFPGQVANVPDYLAAMDLFLMTSRTEGSPTSVIEAQMLGVPVVSFDVGGVKEAMADRQSGILVPPNDARAAREAVIEALADGVWREKAGKAARRFIRENFSEKQFFEKLANLYSGAM